MSKLPSKPLMTTVQVQNHFAIYSKQLRNHEEKLVNITVSNEQESTIAEQQIKSAKDLVKQINQINADLKSPYQETVKMIDSYFKKFMGSIDKALSVASSILLNYKVVEADRLKRLAEESIKALVDENAESLEVINKIRHIAETIKARIFGGWGHYRGEKTHFEPVRDIQGAKVLLDSLENNFPDITSYKSMAPTVAMLRELAINTLNSIIRDIEANTAPDMKFLETYLTKKIDAEIISEEKRLKKQTASSKKKVAQAPAQVMKGVRKLINYQVNDKSRIPLNYLEVDSKAVNDYVSINREIIKKRLDAADGKAIELIGGISFYYDKKVVG